MGHAARRRIESTVDWVPLDERPLQLTIFYFPAAAMVGDIDNIVKPVMDALQRVAYLDDQVVERIVAQKFEPEKGWAFASPSAQLAVALDAATTIESEAPTPIVYIRVDDDLSWRRL